MAWCHTAYSDNDARRETAQELVILEQIDYALNHKSLDASVETANINRKRRIKFHHTWRASHDDHRRPVTVFGK